MLSFLRWLRPWVDANGYAENLANWLGKTRCAARQARSGSTPRRCFQRAVQARTSTIRRRMCRFWPTFVEVMWWRKKDPPDCTMRCRFAILVPPGPPYSSLLLNHIIIPIKHITALRLFYCRIEQLEQISDCQSRLQSGSQCGQHHIFVGAGDWSCPIVTEWPETSTIPQVTKHDLLNRPPSQESASATSPCRCGHRASAPANRSCNCTSCSRSSPRASASPC